MVTTPSSIDSTKSKWGLRKPKRRHRRPPRRSSQSSPLRSSPTIVQAISINVVLWEVNLGASHWPRSLWRAKSCLASDWHLTWMIIALQCPKQCQSPGSFAKGTTLYPIQHKKRVWDTPSSGKGSPLVSLPSSWLTPSRKIKDASSRVDLRISRPQRGEGGL